MLRSFLRLAGVSTLALANVQEVNFDLSKDTISGIVRFSYNGEQHKFSLSTHSVFTEDAQIYEHGDLGTERMEIPASRFYSGQAHGKRALVKLSSDGSFHHGLFEINGSIIQAQPVPWSRHHDFVPLEPLTVLQREQLRGVSFRRLNEPELGVDDEHAEFLPASDLPSDELPEVPQRGKHEVAAMKNWGGVKWAPGCYPGDSDMHKFKLGIVVDEPGWSKHHDDEQGVTEHVQVAVTQASFIYEMQMNIRLFIHTLKIFKTTHNAPDYAIGCHDDSLGTKLDQLKVGAPKLPKNAVWHLFTGCGTDSGTVGLAYIATICSWSGYNTGVSQINDYSHNNTFLTFAHELGHNFGAEHSFEDGQHKTGGIMDYGDGHLNGVYQFNTKYRKAQVCGVLKKKAGHCKGNFETLHDPRPVDQLAGSTECRTVGSSGVGNGHECVFPFKYKPTVGTDLITYEGCTSEDSAFGGGIWCATEVDSSGEMVKGKWGACPWTPQCMGKDSPCTTIGDDGGDEGRECIFPFRYGVGSASMEFSTCTYIRLDLHSNGGNMWCATKVDEDGTMVEWGECSRTDYCTNQWKTVGWAGIPPNIATEYGNQAWNRVNDLKDEGINKAKDAGNSLWEMTGGKVTAFFSSILGKVTAFFNSIIRFVKCLAGCDEEKTDNEGAQRLYELHAGEPLLARHQWYGVAGVAGCALILGVMAISMHRTRRHRLVGALGAEDGEATGLVDVTAA